MPSRHSSEQKAEFSAVDASQMPEPEQDVFNVLPEYGATF